LVLDEFDQSIIGLEAYYKKADSLYKPGWQYNCKTSNKKTALPEMACAVNKYTFFCLTPGSWH